jgi:hypothetical protein
MDVHRAVASAFLVFASLCAACSSPEPGPAAEDPAATVRALYGAIVDDDCPTAWGQFSSGFRENNAQGGDPSDAPKSFCRMVHDESLYPGNASKVVTGVKYEGPEGSATRAWVTVARPVGDQPAWQLLKEDERWVLTGIPQPELGTSS